MSTAANDPDDPRGLIAEAYRIDGIQGPECRSILIDWMLSLPAHHDNRAALARLLQRYQRDFPNHPMTILLAEGVGAQAPRPARKGGSKARREETNLDPAP